MTLLAGLPSTIPSPSTDGGTLTTVNGHEIRFRAWPEGPSDPGRYKRPVRTFGSLPREMRDLVWKELLTFKGTRFRKVDRQTVTPLHADLVPLDFQIHVDRNRLEGRSGAVLDLHVFLVNKQVFAESSTIFYSSNEFILNLEDAANQFVTNVAQVRGGADEVKLKVRPEMTCLRLEKRTTTQSLPGTFSVNRALYDFSNLHTVTLTMPAEPTLTPVIRGSHAPLEFVAHVALCLRQGRIKCLRLIYPPMSRWAAIPKDPHNLLTVRLLLRSSNVRITTLNNNSQFCRFGAAAWDTADVDAYGKVFRHLQDSYNLRDDPCNTIAKYEGEASIGASYSRLPVVVMTRVDDIPIKKDVVDRPLPNLIKIKPHKPQPETKSERVKHPPAVRDYINRAFGADLVDGISAWSVQKMLIFLIKQAYTKRQADLIDWPNYPLPHDFIRFERMDHERTRFPNYKGPDLSPKSFDWDFHLGFNILKPRTPKKTLELASFSDTARNKRKYGQVSHKTAAPRKVARLEMQHITLFSELVVFSESRKRKAEKDANDRQGRFKMNQLASLLKVSHI